MLYMMLEGQIGESTFAHVDFFSLFIALFLQFQESLNAVRQNELTEPRRWVRL